MNTLPVGTLNQWTLILGVLMPLLASVVIQTHWPRPFKTLAGVAACLLAAGVQLALQGQLNAANLGVNFVAIFAQTIVYLKGFWAPLGVTGALGSVTDLPVSKVPPAP